MAMLVTGMGLNILSPSARIGGTIGGVVIRGSTLLAVGDRPKSVSEASMRCRHAPSRDFLGLSVSATLVEGSSVEMIDPTSGSRAMGLPVSI
jgi:hypothetical protein